MRYFLYPGKFSWLSLLDSAVNPALFHSQRGFFAELRAAQAGSWHHTPAQWLTSFRPLTKTLLFFVSYVAVFTMLPTTAGIGFLGLDFFLTRSAKCCLRPSISCCEIDVGLLRTMHFSLLKTRKRDVSKSYLT